MFNRYIWSLYHNSPHGQKVTRQAFPRFARFARSSGYENWRIQLDSTIPVLTAHKENPAEFHLLDDPIKLRKLLEIWFESCENLTDGFLLLLKEEGLYCDLEDQENPDRHCFAFFGGGKHELDVATHIGPITTVMHRMQPDAYIPYYFQGRFKLLSDTCQFFQIPLPAIPGKLQKKERALFYLEINRALQEFRQRHGLSPAELNAFLYDFAPACLAENADDELPAPQRAWFLMAGVGTQDDFTLLDNADQKTESLWRGNRDARRGDIAVLWCASPRAHLHSLWRIVEDGHDDPFAHWYSLVRIGLPQVVPHLKIKDLKSSSILAQSTLVRAHFQGCAGKYFPADDYLALLELCTLHGASIDVLPRIPPSSLLTVDKQILNERGVEMELIEPLLKRLGFNEHDWQRQIVVRMGRGEKVYPDYAIGFKNIPDHESARIIVESKYRIATRKDLVEAFRQGRSYALRLRASHLVLAALEGIWVIAESDGFWLDSARHWPWQELINGNAEPELLALIGAKIILGQNGWL